MIQFYEWVYFTYQRFQRHQKNISMNETKWKRKKNISAASNHIMYSFQQRLKYSEATFNYINSDNEDVYAMALRAIYTMLYIRNANFTSKFKWFFMLTTSIPSAAHNLFAYLLCGEKDFFFVFGIFPRLMFAREKKKKKTCFFLKVNRLQFYAEFLNEQSSAFCCVQMKTFLCADALTDRSIWSAWSACHMSNCVWFNLKLFLLHCMKYRDAHILPTALIFFVYYLIDCIYVRRIY